MMEFLLAWDAKWANVIVETDCAPTIEAIRGSSRGQLYRDLVLRILKLCR